MTLYVSATGGRDRGSCSTNQTECATISYALSQAVSGATIHVKAGTYREQLSITKDVTIIGRSGQTVIAPSSVVQNDVGTDNATAQFAIVDIHNASADLGAVNLENLVIDGATAGANSFNSCSNNFPGIYYHDASGLLKRDSITHVEMPDSLFGCQVGVGALVASDPGRKSNVAMTHVAVTGFQKDGLKCIDPGTSCLIERSVVTGRGPTSLTAQNGVEAWGVHSLTFTRNKVSQDTYTGPNGPAQATGLLVLNAGTVNVRANKVTSNDVDVYAAEIPSFAPVAPAGAWTFRSNRLTGATDDAPAPWSAEGHGYGDGLVIDSTTNPVTIRGNRAGTNFEYGIALYGARNVTVHSNGTHRNYDGIYVGGPGSAVNTSTGNLIKGNRAFDNANDGIFADVSAVDVGNGFVANALHRNATFEAQDSSIGFGTAGTANTWTHNRCSKPDVTSPSGLC